MADQSLKAYAELFLNSVPFTKAMGLTLVRIAPDQVTTRLTMQDNLVGNAIRGILHGGVISTVIDMTGGLIALANVWDKIAHLSEAERLQKVTNFGTIDLRVDFLRPGYGTEFDCTATLVRGGNRVSVTQMTFQNQEGLLLAIGTATFLVG